MGKKLESINGAANAPQAIGPYSQAMSTGDFLFLSGQIPLDPATGALVGGGIEEQTTQVMKNIEAVLRHCGSNLSLIVKATIFLMSLDHFQTVNGIYEKALGEHKPARSTIQVAGLPKGALVEIEVLALRA